MNIGLTVKLVADGNYIPVKYGVVEMTPAATAGATYCVLQVIRVGWDTENHYNDWKATSGYADGNMYLSGRNTTGMQGTPGALSVVALSAIENYDTMTPSFDQ